MGFTRDARGWNHGTILEFVLPRQQQRSLELLIGKLEPTDPFQPSPRLFETRAGS